MWGMERKMEMEMIGEDGGAGWIFSAKVDL